MIRNIIKLIVYFIKIITIYSLIVRLILTCKIQNIILLQKVNRSEKEYYTPHLVSYIIGINISMITASTSFTISGIPASILVEKASLTDLSGKIVMEFILNEPKQKIEVSQLRKGIYLLQIGESTERISIE